MKIINKKCMYCDRKITNQYDCNNPDDYGLHSKYIDYSDKVVCPKCDYLVTKTNRYIKRIIDYGFSPLAIKELEFHISSINDVLKEIEE